MLTPRSFFALALLALVAGTAAPAQALDVAPWDRVLAAHARQGGVDYAALKADPAAMADLRAFVASLGAMPDAAPLADWLNAYNALVVSAIVERYPLRSVRDVPGFFDRQTHRVGGQSRTLDAIENQIVRERFHDARVHAALVCGASACPALPGRAFRQATLDATLTSLARAMVGNARHVRYENGQLRVSEIFFWFEADFRRDAGSVLAWLRRYDAGHRLDAVPDAAPPVRIPYVWGLNDRHG